MQNLKPVALLLLSVVTLTACGAKPSAETIATPGSGTSSYPEGDVYDMTYQVCTTVCNRTSKIVTWGRPTEVGIAYYADGFPEQMPGNKRIEKMEDRRGITLVIKSKGSLPGMEEPLATERFVPVEHLNLLGFSPMTKEAALKVDGRIEILSIAKVPRLEKEPPKSTAIRILKTKARDEGMIEAGSIWGFMGLTKKDPDLAPQQVEKITWQEGQPPQIITLKAW